MISFLVGRGMGHLGRCVSITEKLMELHLPVHVFAFQGTHEYLSENLQNRLPLHHYEESTPFEAGRQTELLINDWRSEVVRFRREGRLDANTKIVTIYHSDFSMCRNDSMEMREYKKKILDIANHSDIFLHMNLLQPRQCNPKLNCIYIPIPVITREIDQPPGEVKRKLGLQDAEPFILIQMGGGLGSHRYQQIVKWYEHINALAGKYRFVVAGQLQDEDYPFDHRVIKAPLFPNGRNLVNAASLVISKPGMGILADCISTGTPLLFLPADDAEREQKISMLRKILNSEAGRIKRPEELVTKIEHALANKDKIKQKFNRIPANGAEVASKILEIAFRTQRSELPSKREELLRLTPFGSVGNKG